MSQIRRTDHTTQIEIQEAAPADQILAATAPYNFVSLPEAFRPDDQASDDLGVYHTKRLSGWINLRIESKTEIYLRGTHTREEYQAEGNESGRPTPQEKFFLPAGIGRIPGSTLRGMTRNIVELLSESRVDDITNETMFYRTMDGSSLSKFYTDQMLDRSGRLIATDVNAGYICKAGNKYRIYEAQKHNGTQFYRIEKEDAPLYTDYTDEWDRYPIWFLPQTPVLQTRHRADLKYAWLQKNHCTLRDPSQKGADIPKSSGNWLEGHLIASGHVDGKHMHWIIGPRDKSYFEVSDEKIREYKECLTKDVRDNRLSILPDRDNDYIPCFIKYDRSGELLAIGHTAMMRLPYRNSPASLVEELVSGKEFPGLAEGIFGTSAADDTNAHAGSVYFEDAFLTDRQKLTLQSKQPKVLGEPHPTTFPHYLAQDHVEAKMKFNGRTKQHEPVVASEYLSHWDSRSSKKGSVATPRGTKLYWHRPGIKWDEKPGVHSESHGAPIQPAMISAVFLGRIRYDNLTEVQLGALLCALQLPSPGHAHKLGLCKPYGLGSVRIECTLFEIDRSNRYKSLFSESGDTWCDGMTETKNIARYQERFAHWMTGSSSTEVLWQLPRMRELEVMLRFDQCPPVRRTEYLQGPGENISGAPGKKGEFGKRKVLLSPLQIAGESANPPIQRVIETQAPQKFTPIPSPKTPVSNRQEPPTSNPVPEPTKAKKYTLGAEVMVQVVEKRNTATVLFETGETLPGQNVGSCGLNQSLKMFVEELDGDKITKLTRDKALASQLRQRT